MTGIDTELRKYGLTAETYERCLEDVRGKMNGTNDMDWAEIVDKYQLGIHYDTLRKASQTVFGSAFLYEYLQEKKLNANVSSAYAVGLRAEKVELMKERRKLQDERTEYQRLIREEARKESFIDLIKRVFSEEVAPLDYTPSPVIDSDNDMIICLSDIHAGIEVKNFFNSFDADVLRCRLAKYLDEITSIQAMHECQQAYLVLGGDLISGLIHKNLRLQNNENVVEQVKMVSVLIGDFIKVLSEKFQGIHVYSVAGNHSRLSPEKEDHLKGEELDALVPFYLKLMFKDYDNVAIYDNKIDDTIISFTTRGNQLFYGVHGDKDSLSNVVKNLTIMTGIKPDGIIIGHRHHNGYNSEHGVKLIQCGSVVGTDDYCVDHRITGQPEQCVVITNSKSAVRCLYDICLD